MDQLEESARTIMEEYRRRFGALPDVPVADLDIEMRSRLVAVLERALSRNLPLLDYELREFEIGRLRRLWLRLRRRIAHLATHRHPVVL